MNKFIRILLYPLKDIIGAGYSKCYCCGFPWNLVEEHSIKVTEHGGCFATCEDCWNNQSDAAIRQAYMDLYADWIHGDEHNPPLTRNQIGFTFFELMDKVDLALKERYKNARRR